MGGDAEVLEGLDDAGGAEEVDLDGAVERGVEADGGGRVDDDVAAGERGAAVVVEAEAVAADVALDDLYPPLEQLGEAVLAVLLAQAVEGVVLEQLPGGAALDGRAAAGADEQHELAVGHGPEQALDEGGAEEAGRAGDRDARAAQRFSDHDVSRITAPFSTIW